MSRTTDGVTWTPSTGVRHGLPTVGYVSEPQHFNLPRDNVYDVIVIGAGYAGLIAARDLAIQGKHVLLLEARDRLGGRTWHSTINGFNYEMGGGWIHWHMPHIYREVSFYGLQDDWVVTQNPGGKENYCTMTVDNQQKNITHDEEMELMGETFRLFADLDGESLKNTWKYVFGTEYSPKLAEWDKLSCQDRLDQISDKLTHDQKAAIHTQLLQMGGSSLDKMSLLDAVRWWCLGSHSPTGLNDIALHTRLRSGQSELHRRIFKHAVDTGYLSYSFETPIKSIDDTASVVRVTDRSGKIWKAKAVVSTLPLNVLASVEFKPPLPNDKINATNMGSVNKCNKIHVDVNGPEYLSWSAFASPGKGLVTSFADLLTPADNTHLICFGPDPESKQGIEQDDFDVVQSSFKHLLPEDKKDEVIINRIVTHDWNNDEFSRGTWFFAPPNLTSDFLTALQRPHGNVFFASADWSNGWRGWIDGAVQSGMEVARDILAQQERKKQKLRSAGSKL